MRERDLQTVAADLRSLRPPVSRLQPPSIAGVVRLLLALAAWPLAAAADETAIAQELRAFRTTGTVLHVAAHPDDENTALIAYLARGRGYRTAYLSLTRGDGGQNELGSDFDARLGVLRTQELLAARRLDGGRQFFTRAIDFGFSKSPEETLRFWDREQVLGDVVRIIRQFQPDVLVTRFPVPPGSGGHGHHTASAMLAVEAFRLAGDPQAYPEQLAQGLTPWQPRRVLWNGSGRGANTLKGATVQVDIGGTDSVTGESFATLANRSRGMHKTQSLGVYSDRTGGGPNVQTFMLLAGEAATQDLMDGVDVTWNRLPGGAEIGRFADDLLAGFDATDPSASIPAILEIREKLAALPASPLVTDKRAQLDRILQACLGLRVETRLAHAEILPGDRVELTSRVFFTARNTKVRYLGPRTPTLQRAEPALPAPDPLQPNTETPIVFAGFLPAGTAPSQPYWLREEGRAGIFRVDDPRLLGVPENPPVVPVEHAFTIEGKSLVVRDEPLAIAGEPGTPSAQTERRIAVVPPVSIAFTTTLALFKPGSSRQVSVEITAAREGTTGTLHLDAPTGWGVSPARQPFQLARTGARTVVTFSVTSPPRPQSASLAAIAELPGGRYDQSRSVLNYSHLPLLLLQDHARLKATSLEVNTLGRRIGYLPGAGDSVPQSLEELGYEVVTLRGADLTADRLAGLDAVVIGVRAFNERDDLSAALPAVFAYVENGGVVIAQYNRPTDLKAETLGPYRLSIAGSAPALRVTDETAAVTFLEPGHRVLNVPNKITAQDFDGWVQERGAYFASSWDESHYTPILAMNDPGEPPLRSSLLVARHGRGWYVYTGLSFFRQLPAGHPGAHRLFANLVSLGKEKDKPLINADAR